LKNIVIISPFQFRLRRGIERFTFSLANQFAKDYNIKIIIYSRKGSDNVSWGNWHKNIKIRCLPLNRYFEKIISVIFFNYWLLIDNPSQIILNFLYHGEEYLPKNKKYYYVLHSPISQIPNRYDYIKYIIPKFNSLNLISVSNWVKESSNSLFKVNKHEVIYNGVDPKIFAPKKDFQLKNGLTMISLAALEERKGIQYVIKAMKQFRDDIIEYHIYGGGPFKVELNRLIDEMGLEEKVFIHPSIQNVEEKLKESDIYILLSEGEAFPLGPLEAMSCGLPVIVSDKPPYDEFINPTIGFKANPVNIDEIVNAINQLKDKNKRTQFGENGRLLVEKSFTWKKIANQYYQLFYSS